MAKREDRLAALNVLLHSHKPLSLNELSDKLGNEVPQRTLRRWLASWTETGEVLRSGSARATRYQYANPPSSSDANEVQLPKFLVQLDSDLRTNLLGQIRDLWTHTSTALEGNTLSLGDPLFILEQGLTVSGKPIREHQEVIGHAKAIDLLYQSIAQPLTESIAFEMHKAVQAEIVFDICKPNGQWKLEVPMDLAPRAIRFSLNTHCRISYPL